MTDQRDVIATELDSYLQHLRLVVKFITGTINTFVAYPSAAGGLALSMLWLGGKHPERFLVGAAYEWGKNILSDAGLTAITPDACPLPAIESSNIANCWQYWASQLAPQPVAIDELTRFLIAVYLLLLLLGFAWTRLEPVLAKAVEQMAVGYYLLRCLIMVFVAGPSILVGAGALAVWMGNNNPAHVAAQYLYGRAVWTIGPAPVGQVVFSICAQVSQAQRHDIGEVSPVLAEPQKCAKWETEVVPLEAAIRRDLDSLGSLYIMLVQTTLILLMARAAFRAWLGFSFFTEKVDHNL